MTELTHFDAHGQAHMVDVAAKAATHRIAVASGRITLLPATFALVLLPWLNPFSFGPTAPALQWLVTLAAVAGLVVVCGGAASGVRPIPRASWPGRCACRQRWVPRLRLQVPLQVLRQGLVKLPDLPPCFSRTRTSVMVMPRSTALHMS